MQNTYQENPAILDVEKADNDEGYENPSMTYDNPGDVIKGEDEDHTYATILEDGEIIYDNKASYDNKDSYDQPGIYDNFQNNRPSLKSRSIYESLRMAQHGIKVKRNLLTNRRFLLILAVVILVVIVLIFGMAIGLTRKTSENEGNEVGGVFYQRGTGVETVFTTPDGECFFPSLSEEINLKIIEPLENKIIACGNVLDDTTDYCWLLDQTQIEWIKTDQTPLAIDDSLSFIKSNYLYMFDDSIIYKFDENTEDWTENKTKLYRKSEAACAVSIEDYVIITGGVGHENDADIIEINSLTVEKLPNIHFGRKHHGCIVIDFLERLSIMVVGGGDLDSTASISVEFIWWDERQNLANWFSLDELKISRPFQPFVFQSGSEIIISGGSLENEPVEVEKITFAIEQSNVEMNSKFLNPRNVSRTIELPPGMQC